ncbi:MAG TPA: hypothetical protein VEQ66_16225 [Propionibacteriaceae bacterium]|nr:hypothetical protein [Propionibacteriaceae bacterium]
MGRTAPTPRVEPKREADSSQRGDEWVEATPFRALLIHLMAAGDLSSGAAAELVGISPRLAHRLVHGRGGRALRRIDPHTARKLLRVTTADARAARRLHVAAEPTVQHLHELQAAGWSEADLTGLLGLDRHELDDLLVGNRRSCTQLIALRAAAEASRLIARLPMRTAPVRRAA